MSVHSHFLRSVFGLSIALLCRGVEAWAGLPGAGELTAEGDRSEQTVAGIERHFDRATG